MKKIKKIIIAGTTFSAILLASLGVYAASSIDPYIENFRTAGNDSEIGKLISNFFDADGFIESEFIKLNSIGEDQIADDFIAKDSSKLGGEESANFQKKLSSQCSGGDAIQKIDQDGTVTCVDTGTGEEDTNSGLWSQNGDDLYYNDGKIGIGTDSPRTKLDVSTNSAGLPAILAGNEINDGVTAGYSSIAMGNKSKSEGSYSISLGEETSSEGAYSIAMGRNALSDGNYAFSVGKDLNAEGVFSVAIGEDGTTEGSYAIGIGRNITSKGDYGFAQGYNTKSLGRFGIAMSEDSTATGAYSLSIGRGAGTEGDYSTAIGRDVKANGDYSIALGKEANADGDYSAAIGTNVVVSSRFGTIIGKYGKTSDDDVFAIAYGEDGNQNEEGSGIILNVKQNGNVGIGTIQPNAKLEVNGEVLINNGKVDGAGVSLTSSGYDNYHIDNYYGKLRFFQPGVTRMTIDGNGNVGIVEDAPEVKLHINSTDDVQGNSSANGVLMIGSPDSTHLSMDNNEIMAKDGDDISRLYLNLQGERTIFGGNIEIRGRTAIFGDGQTIYGDNSTAFYVDSLDDEKVQMIFRDKQNEIYGRVYGASDGDNFGLLDGDGNRTYRATKDYRTYFYIDNDVKMYIDDDGGVHATSFIYTSDKRLKKDIHTLENSLEKINKLRGVNFKWKENNEKEIGLIAQEVEKVYPDLVNTNEEDGMKSVKYGNIVAILIEGVKELYNKVVGNSEEIRKLKEENVELKEQLSSLEKRMEVLEKNKTK